MHTISEAARCQLVAVANFLDAHDKMVEEWGKAFAKTLGVDCNNPKLWSFLWGKDRNVDELLRRLKVKVQENE